MLEHVEIRNYALIENLVIDFHEGFNVITGETGAGKSIILGALGLLMGEKADASSIRYGADEITVNALVSIPESHEILPWLEEHGVVPEDGAVIIKRSVKQNGRSVITVQGQLFSRQELTYFADSVIDMHGQSEHQSLLLPDKQRKILDSYAGNENLLVSCSNAYRRISELNKQKQEICDAIEEAKKQEDYLNYALEEIDSARILDENEDDDLKDKISKISQYETIYENVSLTNEKLKEIRTLFYDCSGLLSKASKCDSNLSDYINKTDSLRIDSEDLEQNLREYISSFDYSEDAVNRMQERLSLLQKLKRKYGHTLSDVSAFAEDAKSKLDILHNSELHLDECDRNLKNAYEEYFRISDDLSGKRIKSSRILEKNIEKTLRTLGMPNASFSISVTTNKDKASPCGIDNVVFMISANPGEPQKELRDIASGGELSRVMLALKTVLAKEDSIQTQVFDEVDSGIGGSVALSLANCIKDLSEKKQVIVITHLASVASRADSHFVVSKDVVEGRTFSHLVRVTGNDRIHEIARMLSGDENEITIEHARNMLNQNKS